MKLHANATRTKRALRALSDYLDGGNEAVDSVTDLLTDLRHFCDAHDIDMANCDRIAHSHYLVEREALAQQPCAECGYLFGRHRTRCKHTADRVDGECMKCGELVEGKSQS